MTPERKLLLVIAAVQFVNVLDFMMVMPLGPDFAEALQIPLAQLGWVGASYTAAATVTGIAGAVVLDRFDRRRALVGALLGLTLATALGGFAVDLTTMLGARVLAGAFGGPATSLGLAIVSDAVPAERRGRALGTVLAAFSVASVLGVPAGLELARLGGWPLPFFAVSALGALVAMAARWLLPPLPVVAVDAAADRDGAAGSGADGLAFLRRPGVLLSLAAVGLLMMANFALIPNLATYWQFNFGYPRESLGLLYLVGGLVSFATMRVAGGAADRWGSTLVATLGTVAYVGVLIVGLVVPQYGAPVLALFVGFMIAGSLRIVALQSLTTRIPPAAERGRYMSAQSAVQHIASSLGAVVGTRLLSEDSRGRLVGMDKLGLVAIALASAVPVLLWALERGVRSRERARAAALVA